MNKETLEVVNNYSDMRIIHLMCEAKIGDFEEASYVAKIVLKNLKNSKDLIPSIIKHKGFDLASRCLISLGFFMERMQRLTNRYGYPSPEFYTKLGKREFVREGKREVSEHFEDWTSYMRERFAVKLKKPDELIFPVVYERAKDKKVYFDFNRN